MAPSPRSRTSPSVPPPSSWRWGTSTATANPTSPSATTASCSASALPSRSAWAPAPPPSAAPPPQIVAVAFRQRGVSRVRVRDAATGTLRAVLTPFKGFAGRLRLQLLDVNGDGSADLVVRAVVHGKRRRKVYDAVTLA